MQDHGYTHAKGSTHVDPHICMYQITVNKGALSWVCLNLMLQLCCSFVEHW